jgi:NADH dehydrogenase
MILVTGATGFVGRHLVARLQARGEQVRPLVRNAATAQRARATNIEPAIGDVTDPASLERAMEGVDAAIHLVAIIVEKGSATFERINVQGTRNVVAAARAAGVKRFLHMSANGAQDNPRYPYLQSKWRGEQAVIESGLPNSILRPSLIFGRGDQFFTTLAMVVRLNPIVPIAGDGTSMFQPIWVEDVCTCFLKMLDDDAYLGRSFDVGGPEQLSYEDLVDIVMRVLGTRKPKIHVPIPLMKPVAAAMEALLPRPPVTPGQLDLLEIDNVTAPNPLPELFGIERPAYLQARLDYIKR